MSLRGLLRTIEGGDLGFWCPGCQHMHVLSPGWTFDGNYDAPTFAPSVLTTNGHYCPGFQPGESCWCTFNLEHPGHTSFKCDRCHLFVRAGYLEFLGDSTHSLAGQTVKMVVPDDSRYGDHDEG